MRALAPYTPFSLAIASATISGLSLGTLEVSKRFERKVKNKTHQLDPADGALDYGVFDRSQQTAAQSGKRCLLILVY